MSKTINELTRAENSWVEEQMGAAIQFVSSFSPSDSSNRLTLAALDTALKRWLASDPAPETINGVIDAVGTAFGDSLVSAGVFRWVIVSDEWGTALAVRALPGQGDVLVFRADTVAKRWERRETDFLVRTFADIMASVRSIGDEWKSYKPKAM
jgi:Domain of unknown function (DUF3806)